MGYWQRALATAKADPRAAFLTWLLLIGGSAMVVLTVAMAFEGASPAVLLSNAAIGILFAALGYGLRRWRRN